MEKGFYADWMLPASRGWRFAYLRGLVAGMPQSGANPQTEGWGPLIYKKVLSYSFTERGFLTQLLNVL